MKTENINSHNNFGWNAQIHRKITAAALKYVQLPSEFRRPLITGVTPQKRLFSFFNPINRIHCYNGQKVSSNYELVNHSLDLYGQKLKDSVVDWEFDDCDIAIRKIGEALHILQDLADPTHTHINKNLLLKKKTFDKYNLLTTKANIEKIMTEKPQSAVTDNFYDLFGDTFQRSANKLNPLNRENSVLMPEIIYESLSDACSSTVAFLRRLANLHTMSDSHKIQAIVNESGNSKFLNNLRNSTHTAQ